MSDEKKAEVEKPKTPRAVKEVKLDFDKPYSKVFGVQGVAYLQGGKHFNPAGEAVKDKS